MKNSAHISQPLPQWGWNEPASLPQLGIENIYAKLDSGADSSSLHATAIMILEIEGQTIVEFTPPLLRHQRQSQSFPVGGVRRVRAPLMSRRLVRSSNGQEEERVLIETELKIASLEWKIKVSLCDRSNLRFPLLLGREALGGRCLIDCSREQTIQHAQEPSAKD
ncbi:MAG: RimK/LysX family protein [Polyangiaceae bacterium]|nr:RimK/LysX family protein [Polyangiaceae bacterium]